MKQYSAIDKEAASESIKSIKRHLSYLSQELVVFALFDRNVSTAEKTMMGQKLFSTERPSSFLPYKPKPPVIAFRDGEKPILSSFIGEKSWLLFSLLKLHGSQEWLNIPAEHWDHFQDFKKASEFVHSLSCVNDSAERGIKLIKDFKDACFCPVEREYLAQLVEKHRETFRETGYTKKALNKL